MIGGVTDVAGRIDCLEHDQQIAVEVLELMPAIQPPGADPAACGRSLFTHINTRNFRFRRKPDRSNPSSSPRYPLSPIIESADLATHCDLSHSSAAERRAPAMPATGA
jgi:hypothetical protein